MASRAWHRLGLGLVAFEGADHEGESVLPGQQPDRDLGLQATFLGEPGLAEPVVRSVSKYRVDTS